MMWVKALFAVLGSIGNAFAKVWPALSTYLLGRAQGKVGQLEDTTTALQEDLNHVRRSQQIRRRGRSLSMDERAQRMRRWQTKRSGNKGGR